jgi:hypothetical protein
MKTQIAALEARCQKLSEALEATTFRLAKTEEEARNRAVVATRLVAAKFFSVVSTGTKNSFVLSREAMQRLTKGGTRFLDFRAKVRPRKRGAPMVWGTCVILPLCSL